MSEQTAHTFTERVLKLPEVMRITRLGRTSIYTAMACGDFPRSIPLTGRRAKGWLTSEIASWLSSAAARRV